MTLQIEEGKFYRTRDGRKVGPMRLTAPDRRSEFPWTDAPRRTIVDGFVRDWRADGVFHPHKPGHGADIVAEWADEQDISEEEFLSELREKAYDQIVEHRAQQKDEPGWKMDVGKPRIDLVAPEFVQQTADVLAFGAAKYSERNWEKGMSWGRCFGAMMRHMWAWWGGERNDPESGLPHLAHAACCLMFLMAYENRQLGTDDRKLTVDKPSGL